MAGCLGPATTTSPVVVSPDAVEAEADRRNKAIRVPALGSIVSSPESASAPTGNTVGLAAVPHTITEAQAQDNPERDSPHDDIAIPFTAINVEAAGHAPEVDTLSSGLSIGVSFENQPSISDRAQVQPDDEQRLSSEVETLWRNERRHNGLAEKRSEKLASLRLELGAKLAKLKALLCRQGRKGKWKAFLEEKAIPRATADIYVKKFERSSREPHTSVPPVRPQPPNDKAIKAKAIKAAKTLGPFLQTSMLIEPYLSELKAALLATFESGNNA